MLSGGAGNDTISGGAGDDTLNGGADDDTVDYSSAPAVVVDLDAGTATGDGNDTLSNIENVTGSAFDDVIVQDNADNTINGGDGEDTVDYSAAGSAVTVDLAAGTGSGDGDDTLSNIENVTGSPFADTLTGDGGANVLSGAAGNDTIDGGAGDDRIAGGAGDDAIDGGAGSDTADYSNAPGSMIIDLLFDEALGEGLDTLPNIENVIGSGFNDTIILDGADNDIDGGGGTDTIWFLNAPAVTVDLAAGTASGDGTDTLESIENVIGSAFDDTITGDGGANVLRGEAGNDTLIGGAGDDTLLGGTGDDDMDGGDGTDVCNGGPGSDTAVNCETEISVP